VISRRSAILALLCAAPLAAQSKLQPVTEASYGSIVKAGAGRVTLVNFWATWCVPCRKEMPLLAQMNGRLAAKGFRLVTISGDDPSEEKAAIEFLTKSGLTTAGAYLRTAKDEDAFIRAVEPKWNGALPALLLYDRKGKLLKSYFGETPLATVEAEIKKLL
jgi:thiol-disulfide isomerase/thioredoxin